ncbi:MAG: hypothetical protein ABSG43_21930 [Solirubrobacteraceae bacterium]
MFAPVSIGQQGLALQFDGLEPAGYARYVGDMALGSVLGPPRLTRALENAARARRAGVARPCEPPQSRAVRAGHTVIKGASARSSVVCACG